MSRFVFLFGILFFAHSTAFAQSVTDGVMISADSMFRDLGKKTVRLKGNVQLVFKGQHMSCDKAMLDLNKQTVTADGHIILYNEKVHMEGDHMVFNYKENKGFLNNGFVQSGQVVFEGSVVEKVGENEYIATQAEYTACETCPPGCSFSGKTIDATMGGYARIQRPVFRVGGVPILILPSLIVPLKSSRQSGFLVPGLDFSTKGGAALTGTYFWAIDRSSDLTLSGRYYQKRGYKALEDYRYVLDKESNGRLQGALMEDKGLARDYQASNLGTVDRWFVSYDHYQKLPDDWVSRASIRQTSDIRYVQDFPDEMLGNGDPALESKASITKETDNQYASAEVDVYNNLLKHFPLSENDDAVHRAPEIKYSYKERRLFENGPLFNVDVDYVNFARDRWGYDDMMPCSSLKDIRGAPAVLTDDQRKTMCPSGYVPLGSVFNNTTGQTPRINMGDARDAIIRDGRFDRNGDGTPLDIQRSGQRLDIMPTLMYPFQLWKKFDILPSVTYRETQYRFNLSDPNAEPDFDETAARRYVQTDLKIKTEFSRVFGDLADPKATRWKHSIQPEIGYSYIPWVRMPNHPFFGDYSGITYSRQYDPISDTDINNSNTGVQFDYNDRTFQRRVVNWTIDNRVTQKLFNDGMIDYKTLALFRIGQSYDINEANRTIQSGDSRHPWSPLEGLLDMRFKNFETFTTAQFVPYAHKTNVDSRIRGMLTAKNYLQVGYIDQFIFDNAYNVVDNGETRNYYTGAGYVSKYFEIEGQVDYSDITHKIDSWGYVLNLRPPGRCWVIHFEHTLVVGGDPHFKGSLSFDFGGETKQEATTASQAM